eukprot:tig00001234_g7740.t1
MAAPVGEVPANANEHCPGTQSDEAGKSAACAGCPNASICKTMPKGPDPSVTEVGSKLAIVKHKLLVLSGKGGVGKSTFATQLAYALSSMEKQVGLLDVDICGPSVPRMTGTEGEEVHQSAQGWSPVYVDERLGVMSIGYMLPNLDDAVIWRGPRKNQLIKQFLKDVHWGEEGLDFLIVDTPPGTSDEHLSLVTYLKESEVDGAIIVTTPQEVSLSDVRKEINFCKKTGIPIIGLVENMSGFVCPHCNCGTDIFVGTTGGGKKVAEDYGIPFLGRLPLDPSLVQACEQGKSFFEPGAPDTQGRTAFKAVVARIIEEIELVNPEAGSGGCGAGACGRGACGGAGCSAAKAAGGCGAAKAAGGCGRAGGCCGGGGCGRA